MADTIERSSRPVHDERIKLEANIIHVTSDNPNDFSVWLNTEAGDFDGLCIGCGTTREAAITDAIGVLLQGMIALGKAATISTTAGTGD